MKQNRVLWYAAAVVFLIHLSMWLFAASTAAPLIARVFVMGLDLVGVAVILLGYGFKDLNFCFLGWLLFVVAIIITVPSVIVGHADMPLALGLVGLSVAPILAIRASVADGDTIGTCLFPNMCYIRPVVVAQFSCLIFICGANFMPISRYYDQVRIKEDQEIVSTLRLRQVGDTWNIVVPPELQDKVPYLKRTLTVTAGGVSYPCRSSLTDYQAGATRWTELSLPLKERPFDEIHFSFAHLWEDYGTTLTLAEMPRAPNLFADHEIPES